MVAVKNQYPGAVGADEEVTTTMPSGMTAANVTMRVPDIHPSVPSSPQIGPGMSERYSVASENVSPGGHRHDGRRRNRGD